MALNYLLPQLNTDKYVQQYTVYIFRNYFLWSVNKQSVTVAYKYENTHNEKIGIKASERLKFTE